ncbi:MAG TPA: flagellar basal-body MS-ring/collar protein FliF [Hyphomonas sp.]|nr:flagellar M-ring protein FliF [Hyphomonas sp.]HRI99730.1 flagellar basal-body MS-ring/collar protein FliF [Hyphomonas sp.]HRK67146.1 flagellar basal-body MS-ring/collar protein FliF [Hyphomonas sp.]
MKFIETLKGLTPTRQIALAAAVIGIIAAMSYMIQGATKDPMALLYAGLEPQFAGEIIEELDKTKTPYKIEGGAIFIPQGQRDQVRFALAREGLPRQSVQGYELLDEVNGFSVTSEMYNAAYWRAKEGELTRTILAIPGVTSARVHIGANLRSGFSRSQPAQTASVTLSSARGLSQNQAEAIQYLVALAVSGLKPEDVAVIDPSKGILAGPKVEKGLAEPSVAAEDQASLLEAKILRLLSARVGDGNARVSVSVDVSRERQRISEVSFDPQSRVVRNRTVNDSNQTGSGGAGALTVASNLPQDEGGASGGSSSSSKTSSESISYEINETRRETERLPGQIERISIAVLLNEQALGIDPAAADAATRRETLIADLQQLVISGAGLNIDRGDAISVELMPFQEIPASEMTPAPGLVEQLIQRYFWSGLQALLLGVVVIVLAFGVVRPLLAGKPQDEEEGAATGNGTATGAGAATAGVAGASSESDPFSYLKDYAREREEETAALLQQWLNEDQKVAVNE